MTFLINGAALVRVRGGAHESVWANGAVDLGLADMPITVTPRYYHLDMKADDFGPSVPAETMFNLAEVEIKMRLVHTDPLILIRCWNEAMAGGDLGILRFGPPLPGIPPAPFDGGLAPAGSLMGNGLKVTASGCHYIRLSILSPVLGLPWNFSASYLSQAPFTMPLGTEKSAVILNWRAIPYATPLGYQPVATPSGFTSGVVYDQSGNIIGGTVPTVTPSGYFDLASSGVLLWDHFPF